MNKTRALITTATLIVGLAYPIDKIDDGQWYNTFLQSVAAHAISTGSGTTIAILDTGIDARHTAFRDQIMPGTDITASGDGHTDLDGHGTQVAGLIVAQGRVNGIAPNAKVLPVRIGVGNLSASGRLALGVRWAVSSKASVISISQAIRNDDLLVRQEIEAALAADIVVVAGAGNRPEYDFIGFPAAIPGVVAVTGLSKDGNASANSAAGPEAVIAAPCDDLSTTGLNGTYGIGSGTSYSTAIVAGAVALVRAKFPDLKGPEVVRRLTATAIDKGGPGRDPQYGYGVLNIVGALTADLPTESAAPTATVTQRVTEPPASKGGGFPWWLVVVPVVLAGAVVVFLLVRRKTRED